LSVEIPDHMPSGEHFTVWRHKEWEVIDDVNLTLSCLALVG